MEETTEFRGDGLFFGKSQNKKMKKKK